MKKIMAKTKVGALQEDDICFAELMDDLQDPFCLKEPPPPLAELAAHLRANGDED